MWNAVLLSKFAMRLKILMYLNGEDNTQLAEVLGCNASRVSLLRCCGTRPTNTEIVKLSEHYSITEDFLSGGGSFVLISEDNMGNQNLIFREVLS